MAWLVDEDRVLATVEVADSLVARIRGAVGRDSLDDVLMLKPANGVHTIGVRFPIDVAYCDADLCVLEIVTMKPMRIGRPRLRARIVLEAPRGSFERWGVCVGDRLDLKP